ncbi:MAG: hypothetical protein ACJ8LN_03445, partial [Sulfurifustis sp.]
MTENNAFATAASRAAVAMVHRHDGPDASLVLSIGDAIIRHGNTLAFVPDERMGDDADAVKRGLRAVF